MILKVMSLCRGSSSVKHVCEEAEWKRRWGVRGEAAGEKRETCTAESSSILPGYELLLTTVTDSQIFNVQNMHAGSREEYIYV